MSAHDPVRTTFLLALLAATALGQGRPPALVDVAKVERRELPAGRTFVGTIEAQRTSVVGAEVAGRVTKVHVEAGARVEAGAELAQLDTETIALDLLIAKAQLQLRRAELDELTTGSRPEDIAVAKARVQRDQAEVDFRQWKLESAQRLFERSTITEDEVKEARFNVRAAEAKLAESRAVAARVAAGERSERIERARAQLAQQQAQIARLEHDQKRHTIRAPFAGSVTRKHTEAGQWLETGTMVVTLLALDDVDAVFPVPERDAARLKRGAAVDVYVPALGGKRFQGTLNTVVPQADLRGRTFPVKIRVNNTLRDGGPVLMAGMVARAAIGVGEKTLSLLVPKDAVVLGGPSPTVYVVSADGSVRPVPVELGAGYEAKLVVKGALKEGDVVVVRGNERLQPGQKVKARS